MTENLQFCQHLLFLKTEWWLQHFTWAACFEDSSSWEARSILRTRLSFLLLQTGTHPHGKAIIQPMSSQCFYTATITVVHSLVGCKCCLLSLPRPVNSQLMQQCPSTWGNWSRIPKHTSSIPFPHLIHILCYYSPPKHSTNCTEKHLQDTLLKREGYEAVDSTFSSMTIYKPYL